MAMTWVSFKHWPLEWWGTNSSCLFEEYDVDVDVDVNDDEDEDDLCSNVVYNENF